jgi:hypothetical protein
LLNLTKLAVRVRDITHLHALQVERAVQSPPLWHHRQLPGPGMVIEQQPHLEFGLYSLTPLGDLLWHLN